MWTTAVMQRHTERRELRGAKAGHLQIIRILHVDLERVCFD